MLEQQVEQVRVCRICGHINPPDDATRCGGCWSLLSGSDPIPRDQAERRSRFPRIPVWRKRHLILPAVLALAYVIWQAVTLYEVGPLLFPPPGPSTQISADTGLQAWAQGRRTAESTAFTPDSAPVPTRIKWKYSSSKPLVTSPAVVDDRVYFTTEDGRTMSLDSETGQVVWEYHNGTPSSSTPAVTEDLVIFAVRPGIITALDRDTATVRWERDLGSPILSSPLVADGTVFIGAADSALHALDAATGRERWSFRTEVWVVAPVAYADGTVIVASQDHRLNVLSSRTARRQLLYTSGTRRRIAGGPVIQGDIAYFTSRDGRVWAIDRRARTFPFERTLLKLKLTAHVWGWAGAPVQKGSIWSKRVGGEVNRPPAVTPTTVYAVSKRGMVTALDAVTGEERWSTQVSREITAAPTVAGNTVLIGTWDGLVLGLDSNTGAVLWEFQTGDKITASPVVAGDTMYVASRDGTLYAVTGP